MATIAENVEKAAHAVQASCVHMPSLINPVELKHMLRQIDPSWRTLSLLFIMDYPYWPIRGR